MSRAKYREWMGMGVSDFLRAWLRGAGAALCLRVHSNGPDTGCPSTVVHPVTAPGLLHEALGSDSPNPAKGSLRARAVPSASLTSIRVDFTIL